jgi:ElaB/YqjD/DUF883 family membrane-anchored ribosome-binding protein
MFKTTAFWVGVAVGAVVIVVIGMLLPSKGS